MGRQVKVTLPDTALERADLLAGLQGCSRSELLAAILSGGLAGTEAPPSARLPVSLLPDREVLDLADINLRPADDERLGDLLADQREGRLTPAARVELHTRMEAYGGGQLREATAFAEVVRRGLRPRLNADEVAGIEGAHRRARQRRGSRGRATDAPGYAARLVTSRGPHRRVRTADHCPRDESQSGRSVMRTLRIASRRMSPQRPLVSPVRAGRPARAAPRDPPRVKRGLA
jgi:hypothetical protein